MSLASCVAASRSTTLFTTLEHGIWGCLISFSWAMVIHIWFTLECENYVFSDQEDAVLRPIPSSSHQWSTEECFLALQSWLLGSDETPSSEQSSCVCRSCSFTLVLSVCHLCVSPPSAQGSDEVPFPSWNLLTWWEGVFHGTFQPPLFRAFVSVCHPEHFFTSSRNTVISTLSLSMHPISLESPRPQIFSFNSDILADCNR